MSALECGWGQNAHRNLAGKVIGGRLRGEHGQLEGSTFIILEKFNSNHVNKAW
jgi:hypothetical protein